MNINDMILNGKRKLATIGIAVAVALLSGAILFSCAGNLSAGETGAGHAVSTVLDEAAEGINVPDSGNGNSKNVAADIEGNSENAFVDSESAEEQSEYPQARNTVLSNDSNVRTSNGAHEGNSSSSVSAPAQSMPQKKWIENTERVWVVDRAAWTESIPVYKTIEVSICNICGADITGNTSAHAKAHMKAGEGSGHHSEVRQEISGYDTVNHEEEGRWETRVVGGH